MHSFTYTSSLLGAAQYISVNAEVTDEESLEDLLADVQRQFDVVEEGRALALEVLEDVFEHAAKDARETLQEVLAGFPSSGGSFAAWKQELFRRRLPAMEV